MGSFVSDLEFRHDVFISYAHVDNQTCDHDERWVERLVNQLREKLTQKLERGQPDIWFDHRIAGNEPFSEQINEGVDQSATLLIILSKSYLSSEWCEVERQRFLNAIAQPDNVNGRIFLVFLDDLQPEDLSKPLQGARGYKFFVENKNRQRTRIVGMPEDEKEDRRLYYEKLRDLTDDLADKLMQMKHEAGTLDNPEALPPDERPTVFLAEVSPDFEEIRDHVRRHLKQMNFRVLPETFYERSPEAYQSDMEKDLEQSLVFVQLLGPYVTPKTNNLPKGYEGLQLDVAKAKGIPILRWLSPEVESDSYVDPDLLSC